MTTEDPAVETTFNIEVKPAVTCESAVVCESDKYKKDDCTCVDLPTDFETIEFKKSRPAYDLKMDDLFGIVYSPTVANTLVKADQKKKDETSSSPMYGVAGECFAQEATYSNGDMLIVVHKVMIVDCVVELTAEDSDANTAVWTLNLLGDTCPACSIGSERKATQTSPCACEAITTAPEVG